MQMYVVLETCYHNDAVMLCVSKMYDGRWYCSAGPCYYCDPTCSVWYGDVVLVPGDA